MNDFVMKTEQIKRHKRKPTVEVSVGLIRKMLKAAGIKPIPTHAYNIYSCGHIIDRDDDESIIKYMNNLEGHSRGVRVCPICWKNGKVKSQLFTKYKKCNCGAEHTSKKIQPSDCCAVCSASRKALKGETPKHEIYNNGHMADPTKCFCIHRKECIVTYAKYEAIPCKKCGRFREKEGDFY